MNAVFDRLSQIFSKEFAVASFLPVVIVGLLNVVVGYSQSRWFRTLVDEKLQANETLWDQVFSIGVALFAAAALAFFLWLCRDPMRLALEGRYWYPGRNLATAYHRGRIQRAVEELDEANRAFVRLAADLEEWKSELKAARETLVDCSDTCDYSMGDAAASAIEELQRWRTRRKIIPHSMAHEAQKLLSKALARNPVEPPARDKPDDSARKLLRAHHDALLGLLLYARTRSRNETDRLSQELQLSYPEEDPAPTALGNISKAMDGYTMPRYGFGLQEWWSRLESVLGGGKALQPVVNARANLDAVITFSWLIAPSALAWGVYLAISGYSPLAFAAVIGGGVVLSVLAYVAAVRGYLALSESARASVDLHRRELLRKMEIKPPSLLEDERVVWRALDEHLRMGTVHHVRHDAKA